MIKLYKDDVKNIIEKMIKNCEKVDAIITDPPYNIARENNFKTMGRAGIDFGEWDKGFDLTGWIKDINKIVNKNGSVIIFNAWRNLGNIAQALEENGFEIKDCVRWVKNNPMPRNLNRRYITDYEFFIWAVKKGSKWTFNKPEDIPYLRCEYKHSLTPKSEKEFGVHTTQKPLKLMEDIIKVHTNKHEVVFDPFMGSGTTGVAAIKLNRSFIGVEIDQKYFELANERIEKERELWKK